MKSTTAQRFGSLGKSFVSPSAAAAVIGAALLTSDTSDTSETAWSPAAACLLPDVLPVAGTLLSYGGSRQLAAGGTVTHSGAIAADGQVTGSSFRVASGALETYSGSTRLQYQSSVFTFIDSGRLDIASGGVGQIRLGGTGASHAGIYNSGTTTRFRTADNSADGPISCGAITASSLIRCPRIQFDYNAEELSSVSNGFVFQSATQLYFYQNSVLALKIFNGILRLNAGVCYIGGSGIETTITGSNTNFKIQSNSISLRNAADSGDAPLSCGAITASGAIQETPTQSALDPTTTNIPSGKRQGWYNSTLSEFRDWVNIGGTLLKSAAYT